MEFSGLTKSGEGMYALATELFPLCRSITGPGLRQSLTRIAREIPVQIHEVPSHTPVFDWEIPLEWEVREAFINGPNGERVVDFRDNNLHLLHYSVPFRGTLSLEQLKPHLHSLPKHPDWIPYRSSYYNETWGFCLSHNKLLELPIGLYEVVVDTRLFPGSLSYGEFFVSGDTEQEVLFSAHVCHPSLANDNLSGVVVATALAQHLATLASRKYGYRFLFAPATIGAIAWLSRNEANIARIRHGLTLALLGDTGSLTYKQSRLGTAFIDRTMEHVLHHCLPKGAVREFVPYGYDERQYCSPGIDIPMGCLMRTPNGEFPEYHTSADNLNFICAESLEASLDACLRVIEILESDRVCLNLASRGEPRLGKRGLYSGLKGGERPAPEEMALFWVLSYSDGHHSLLAIAERAKLPFAAVNAAAAVLERYGLITTL